MTPDLSPLNLTPAMIWAATYFMHSSLLLSSVWLWFRWKEPQSHALREIVWKLAAVGGLVTASLQLGLGIESPVNRLVDVAWKSSLGSSESVRNDVSPVMAKSVLPERGASWLETDGHDFTQPANLGDDGSSTILLEPEYLEESATGTRFVADDARPSAIAKQVALAKSTDSLAQSQRWTGPVRNLMLGVFAACCGAIVALSGWGLFRLLAEQAEFGQRLKTCRIDTDGPARRALDELLSSVEIRRSVRLMLDDQDLEPGACGWFQWQIVLPSRAVEVLSPEELRGLLAHELAHLVRGDQWWLLLGRLLAVCFGWQPLNRIALREWQRASEYLCDAWAIQRQVPRLSLARCLTTVAEWRLVGLATVAGMGSGNLSNLSQRVERLVDDVPLADPWQRYSRRHLIAAAGCLVAVGMVSLAPAATLPSRASVAQKRAASDLPAPGTTTASNHPDVDNVWDEAPESSALLATEEDVTGRQSVLITVRTVEVVRQQTSDDLGQLQAELRALRHFISRSPQFRNHPLWQAHLQSFRQRMEKIQQVQNLLVAPL